jgi:hypothetical protein
VSEWFVYVGWSQMDVPQPLAVTITFINPINHHKPNTYIARDKHLEHVGLRPMAQLMPQDRAQLRVLNLLVHSCFHTNGWGGMGFGVRSSPAQISKGRAMHAVP